MPAFPRPVLVDPRAQLRAHARERLRSIAVGVLLAGASAVPFLLAIGH